MRVSDQVILSFLFAFALLTLRIQTALMEMTALDKGQKAFGGWYFDTMAETETLVEFGELCGWGFFLIEDHLGEGFRGVLEEGSMIG